MWLTAGDDSRSSIGIDWRETEEKGGRERMDCGRTHTPRDGTDRRGASG
jgi:hypothetical protein